MIFQRTGSLTCGLGPKNHAAPLATQEATPRSNMACNWHCIWEVVEIYDPPCMRINVSLMHRVLWIQADKFTSEQP